MRPSIGRDCGRDYVIPDDIKYLAPLVLAHRLTLYPSIHHPDQKSSQEDNKGDFGRSPGSSGRGCSMNLILWMMLLSGMVWLYGEFWATQTAGKVSWSIKVEGDRHREGQEVSLWAHVENYSWLPIFWIRITQPLPEGLWIQRGR